MPRLNSDTAVPTRLPTKGTHSVSRDPKWLPRATLPFEICTIIHVAHAAHLGDILEVCELFSYASVVRWKRLEY